jgi:hypothetical protein
LTDEGPDFHVLIDRASELRADLHPVRSRS